MKSLCQTFDNLDGMDKFLEEHKLQKLIQEEITWLALHLLEFEFMV